MTSPQDLGERVAELRRRRNMSQRDLAAAAGRSESWVSQVERGVLPLERISVLQTVADALGVPIADLRPDTLPDLTAGSGAQTSPLQELRLALSTHPALDVVLDNTAGGQVASLDPKVLTERVDSAWQLAHASSFDALAQALVTLLRDLETARRTAPPRQRQRIAHMLASGYQCAAVAFARQNEPDAAWVAADRAVQAAELSGDPLAVVAGLYRLAHAFIMLGQLDQAERATTSALSGLQPLTQATDCASEALSLHGAFHLIQAVLYAREGDRDGTAQALAAAQHDAKRIGADRNDYGTEFGPTNVAIHTVTTAVDLGDAGTALHAAAKLDATGVSVERQARLHLDIARAHAQRRHLGDAIDALLRAEQLTPQMVHNHPTARTLITDLLAIAGRRPPATLVELAERAAVD